MPNKEDVSSFLLFDMLMNHDVAVCDTSHAFVMYEMGATHLELSK